MFKIYIVCVLATLLPIIMETKLQRNQEKEDLYHSRNISKSLNLIILQEFVTRSTKKSTLFNIYAKYHPSRNSYFDDIVVSLLEGLPEISVKVSVNHTVNPKGTSNYLILIDTLESLR